jgi:hypothetical protein
MSRVIDAETLKKSRTFPRLHEKYPLAEEMHDSLSAIDRFRLRFGPVRVGVVDFTKQKAGYLPLYLFEHNGHLSIDYVHGFPGHNERVTCHCGHNHYFLTSRLHEVRAFCGFLWYMITSQKSRPSA